MCVGVSSPHNLTLLSFCLPLIPLGVWREERDVCLLHVGMPGQEGCYTEKCLFDSVNPGLPGASSCFAATESCVICTLSWVLDWQSCELSKPFDPLLLDTPHNQQSKICRTAGRLQ